MNSLARRILHSILPIACNRQTSDRKAFIKLQKNPAILRVEECESRDQPGSVLGYLTAVAHGGTLPDPLFAVAPFWDSVSAVNRIDDSTGDTSNRLSTQRTIHSSTGTGSENSDFSQAVLANSKSNSEQTESLTRRAGGNDARPESTYDVDDPLLVSLTDSPVHSILSSGFDSQSTSFKKPSPQSGTAGSTRVLTPSSSDDASTPLAANSSPSNPGLSDPILGKNLQGKSASTNAQPSSHLSQPSAGLNANTILNQPPGGITDGNGLIAVPVSAMATGGNPVTINVLANDYEDNGSTLELASVGTPLEGTAIGNANGTITYTPGQGAAGTDTFTYEITDGNGNYASSTVSVSFGGSGIVALPVTAGTTSWANPVVINVLANDYDTSGASLELTSVSSPFEGSATANSDGTITYTPNHGASGTDSFTYQVTDGNGNYASNTVTMNIGGGGTLTANPVTASTTGATPVTINVLSGCSDSNGDLPELASVATPTLGTVVENANGTITYTPIPGASGSDSFQYQITDANGNYAFSTVTVNITSSLVAVAATGSTTGTTPVTIPVLANDYDTNGSTPILVSVGSPSEGTVVANYPAGTVTYTPNPNTGGTDVFSYEISDGNGNYATSTVQVYVGAAGEPIAAVPVSAATTVTTPVNIPVLANDFDTNGSTLTLYSVGTPLSGTAIANSNGTITYTPRSGSSGSDVFSYTITDGIGDYASGRVTVSITGSTLVANPATASTMQNMPVTVNVLANDYDTGGATPTLYSVGTPSEGTAVANSNGTITYTPNPGATGTDTFPYTITNGADETASSYVSIPIIGIGGIGAGVSISVNVSQLVPVDASNTNASPWLMYGIPKVRDLDATNFKQADPQLIKTTVTVTGGFAGFITYTQYEPGEAMVAFWQNQTKSAPVNIIMVPGNAAGAWTYTFYTEGTAQSSSINDLAYSTWTFTPFPIALPAVSTTLSLNVYPIVQTTQTTTSAVTWTATNPVSGILGLTAGKNNLQGQLVTAGMVFSANVLMAGNLTLNYLQDMISVQNGANGTTGLVNGKNVAVGATFAKNIIGPKSVKIKANSGFAFPGLDTAPGKTFYPSTSQNNPGGSITITADDGPSTGIPSTPNVCKSLDTLDLKKNFQMFLVVQFSDGSIYGIANDTWSANFYATTNKEDNTWEGGPSVINAASKVTDQGFSRSNTNPLQTQGTVANDGLDWESA